MASNSLDTAAASFVQLSAIGHSYREGSRLRDVLDEVSLTVGRGEIIALLGRSGSGKSTLLNIISGIDAPQRGTVHIAGQELTGLGEAQRTRFRRRHIGFIYQFFNLIPTLTVAENVALVLELNAVGVTECDRRVSAMLAQLSLADLAGRFPDQLSGGEQQRVAIARALVHRPALVLADEPTGNLDAQSGSQVMALLRQLVTAQHGTLLVVTHSRAVAKIADRVIALDGGRLVSQQQDLAW
jgi:putative ABC transport system ATP-binding protein